MGDFKTVCRVGDIPDGEGKTVSVGGKLIAVFRTGTEFHAIDDTCPHMGASLSGGAIEAGVVTCPWHAWRFRLSDGAWMDYNKIKIGCYQVRVQGDEVQVEAPPEQKKETMNYPRMFRGGALVALAGLLLTATGEAQVARPPAFVPKFEAMAETRLLMEGLANSNYRSLQRLLKTKPADNDTWVFVRGQALLTAETGNLLLLRPPRNTGRETWMRLAMDMRGKAGTLARQASQRDHARARAALENLTASCNRCHQTFRVPVKVGPEADKSERDTE